jgi:hypothetical protein
MLDALDITEAEAAGLSRLAVLDLAMAEHYAARAQAEADPHVSTRLSRSYHRAARSYRQTLGLKARLQRELIRIAQEVPSVSRAGAGRADRPGAMAVARRIHDLRTALVRLAWDEAERPESEAVDPRVTFELFLSTVENVGLLVADESLSDGFCTEPVDDHVARLALELDFPFDAIARWRELPDPPVDALRSPLDDADST